VITGDEVAFPVNVVNALAERYKQLYVDTAPTPEEATDIKLRPLNNQDRSETMGIYPGIWTPNEDSYEMRGMQYSGEPTLGRYLVMIQNFIKDGDRERGAAKHSIFATRTRNVLYRDPVLRVALPQLVVTDLGVTERVKRWEVRSQRYFSNELGGTWVYLSSLECLIETETT
jgi:hypothetical protein